MSNRRVIVAPFEPFAGKRRNRARDAVQLLRGEELAGAPVEIVDLPVAYAAIPDAVASVPRPPSSDVRTSSSAELVGLS